MAVDILIRYKGERIFIKASGYMETSVLGNTDAYWIIEVAVASGPASLRRNQGPTAVYKETSDLS